MTRARFVIELPDDIRQSELDRIAMQIAQRLGGTVERSSDIRTPLHYEIRCVHKRDSGS